MMIPQLFLNDKTIVIKNNFVNIKIPFDDINTIEENPKIGFKYKNNGRWRTFWAFWVFQRKRCLVCYQYP